jgi:hypothetical protein
MGTAMGSVSTTEQWLVGSARGLRTVSSADECHRLTVIHAHCGEGPTDLARAELGDGLAHRALCRGQPRNARTHVQAPRSPPTKTQRRKCKHSTHLD